MTVVKIVRVWEAENHGYAYSEREMKLNKELYRQWAVYIAYLKLKASGPGKLINIKCIYF